MSSRAWDLRIQDILDSINAIANRLERLTFEDLVANETIAKAVLYDFVIIGEASANLPDSLQQKYPDIPWDAIVSMRNRVAHEYFRVSLEIVWDTYIDDFEVLRQQLEYLLQQEQQNRNK